MVNNMNSTLIGDEAGLLLYYRMNEGSGTSITDYASDVTATSSATTWQKNSGIKIIRIKQGATTLQTSTGGNYTFTLSSGTYTVEVEDNVGNITTKSVTL
jgi:uncharacterized protein YfaS (alpha-2-macroglobulin family)